MPSQIEKEYKENDEEWIGWKAGKAAFISSSLSNPKLKNSERDKN